MRPALLRLVFTVLLASLLLSCESALYYGQAAKGQLSLLMARRDIQRLLQNPQLDAATRETLTRVLEAREFARDSLALDPAKSYLSYVALERPFVLWNVFAAPEFSTQAANWCYPIAGCVSYRGYFSEAGAKAFAESLQAQQWDVYSGGVDAYSTLGWFDDPLTSAVLRRSPESVVALIFHELAHRRVYLPGDTTFNESFATFVEQEGLRRWLALHPQPGLLLQLAKQEDVEAAFVALIGRYREQLKVLYEQDIEEETMRVRKAAIQQALREEYADVSKAWEYSGYDRWFAGPLNNAQLATVASYNDLVPAFARLLQEAGGDLARFYAKVTQISKLDAQQRAALLAEPRFRAADEAAVEI